MLKSIRVSAMRLLVAACAGAMVVGATLPAEAQRDRDRDRDAEEQDPNRTFSPRVGEKLLAGQELQDAGDTRGALGTFEEALEMRGVSAYERGVIYQLIGQLRYELEDERGAIAAWENAITQGDLLPQEKLNLSFNIGQIYLVLGDYRQAIQRIEQWIRDGGDATDKVHLNLVAAYAELDDFRGALTHGRLAFQKAAPRERKHYDVMNYLFTELDMPRERAELLQEMVQLFPEDKTIWTSIAALYAQAGQERKAFEINKIMYINGMLTTESEIMRVVDYYSFYEVPYRGARILEREMNRGRVESDLDNFRKLARLYRQAREWDAAEDPLTRAAELSGDGRLFQQLGEAYYAQGKAREAERALLQSLEKGGVQRPGNVWIVIGNARYEAGNRESAIAAFEQAAKYQYSRRSADGWIEFITGEIAREADRLAFQARVKADEIRVACERRAAGTDIIDSEPVLDPDTGEPVDCAAVIAAANGEVVDAVAATDADAADGAVEEPVDG